MNTAGDSSFGSTTAPSLSSNYETRRKLGRRSLFLRTHRDSICPALSLLSLGVTMRGKLLCSIKTWRVICAIGKSSLSQNYSQILVLTQVVTQRYTNMAKWDEPVALHRAVKGTGIAAVSWSGNIPHLPTKRAQIDISVHSQ